MSFVLVGFAILWGVYYERVNAEESPAPAEESRDNRSPMGMLPAGHSFHGEVFNEGPRQAAILLDGMGNVHFPVTTTNELAQKFFNQGIAQLHGFWYFESERSFRQVAALDPNCAMAYWGMAMSNPGNERRAKGFIAEAVKRKASATAREQRYIEALQAYWEAGEQKKAERTEAYTRALENIIYEYPEDIEAKAFLALHLWNGRNAGVKIQSYAAVDALLDQVFSVNPMHPAHHYRIHLWDYEKPERALASSALCGPCLPGVAHMWHMPGHIYSRLKRYDDACYQQEASARVDHAHMMRFHVLPDQIHNYAHNNEWLIRNLIHVGRAWDALDLAMNLIELPQHPKYNTVTRSGCSASYGRQRLWDVIRTFELWDEFVKLVDTPYFAPTDSQQEQVRRLRYLGIAYARSANAQGLQHVLTDLQGRLEAQKKLQQEAVEQAERKAKEEEQTEEQITKRIQEARQPFDSIIRDLEAACSELSGWQCAMRDDWGQAYERLKKAGGVDTLLLAEAQLRAGHTEEALQQARQFVRQHDQEVPALVRLVQLLWLAGVRQEAQQTFDQLRAIAADADLDCPLFARLAPVAAELGYPADWRLPRSVKGDLGQRPPLNSLGPWRWEPPAVEPWTLVDAENHFHSLQNYRGKMVIIIFFLGHGCLHCQQQLNTFAPMAEQFREKNIEIIAISTDSLPELTKAWENYGERKLPFPIVSDDTLDTFKKYRCYDDFECQPLHGTFLIDGEGRDVWHDISFEPFMDAKFVLQEAERYQRLLEFRRTVASRRKP